jgi:hypothetical protein
MSGMRVFKAPLREQHVGKFKLKQGRTSTTITYDGDILVRVRRPTGGDTTKCDRLKDLPTGFHNRLARHLALLLTGVHSALWDEQAVFGDGVDGQEKPLMEPAP